MGLRLAVVEDDAFTRMTLSAALKAKGLNVVMAAADAAEAALLSQIHAIDAAILDLHLGIGPTGIDVAQALRRQNPGVGIVFLTSFDDPRLLSTHLPQLPGNSQYLTKSSIGEVDQLVNAIQLAVIGRGNTASKLKNHALGKFTDSQIETLRLVAQGLSNAEIARRRFVTERAVEVSISRVAKALGLESDSSRNQRVHMAKVFFRALGRSPVDQD
jgi:two-component system nitrate/nitrite response regulator NarL